MTEGEKRIADLLENLTKHVVALRADVDWFKRREQQKTEAIRNMSANLPKMPKR